MLTCVTSRPWSRKETCLGMSKTILIGFEAGCLQNRRRSFLRVVTHLLDRLWRQNLVPNGNGVASQEKRKRWWVAISTQDITTNCKRFAFGFVSCVACPRSFGKRNVGLLCIRSASFHANFFTLSSLRVYFLGWGGAGGGGRGHTRLTLPYLYDQSSTYDLWIVTTWGTLHVSGIANRLRIVKSTGFVQRLKILGERGFPKINGVCSTREEESDTSENARFSSIIRNAIENEESTASSRSSKWK